MRTEIHINMDNAAFGENPDWEVGRILRELAKRIEGHPHFSAGHDQALRDINGNEVGRCDVYDS